MTEPFSNIFIIGSPRSGTSALAEALSKHPKLWASAELVLLLRLLRTPWLKQQFDETLNTLDEGAWLKDLKISYEEYAASIGKGLDALWRSRSGGRDWVDSTPAYTLIVPELMVYFPQARFLHMLRDGQAVVNSALLTGFPYEQFKEFKAACEMWNFYANLGHKAAQDHPGRVLEIRHEHLTGSTEAEFERIFAFLGLEACAGPSTFIRTRRVNSSYLNVDKGDLQYKVKNPADMPQKPWRDWSVKQKKQFAEICGETMRALGYTLD